NWEKLVDDTLDDVFRAVSSFPPNSYQPWKEFCCEFSTPPLQLYHLQKRILTNVNFFTLNYVVVALAILALEIVFDPLVSAVYFFMALSVLLTLFIRRIRIGYGKRDPSGVYALLCLSMHLVILLLSRRFTAVLWRNGFILLFVLLHASLHKRSIKARIAFKNSAFAVKENGSPIQGFLLSMDESEVVKSNMAYNLIPSSVGSVSNRAISSIV
ncbi:hypothetical protein WA577_007033, partial [Blastocystis sp. JDR]